MTQPSPQDALPPDLTELARHLSELGDDDPLGGPWWSQRCYDAARAIAAIPEMRAEIDRLLAVQATCDVFKEDNRRLRAEKSAIEAAAIERCAHLCDSFEEPHMARLIRKLAKAANETEAEG